MSLFTDIAGSKEVKTEAIKAVVKSITGENPIVDKSNPNVNVIRFTKSQQAQIQGYLSKGQEYVKDKSGKTTSKPSNVVIDHKPLWVPFFLKKTVPFAIGTLLIGYLAGRYIK